MSKKYTSAKTSEADKVIDALSEVTPRSNKPAYVCNKCGSTDYEARSPLGGPKIKVCVKCGSKLFSASANIMPLINAKNPHGQGSTRGPTKSAYKPKGDKHQPKYRNKGKRR